jgi:hypothetical protein
MDVRPGVVLILVLQKLAHTVLHDHHLPVILPANGAEGDVHLQPDPPVERQFIVAALAGSGRRNNHLDVGFLRFVPGQKESVPAANRRDAVVGGGGV